MIFNVSTELLPPTFRGSLEVARFWNRVFSDRSEGNQKDRTFNFTNTWRLRVAAVMCRFN